MKKWTDHTPRTHYPDEPRRCDTGIVEQQMGECLHCSAAQGEECRQPIKPLLTPIQQAH